MHTVPVRQLLLLALVGCSSSTVAGLTADGPAADGGSLSDARAPADARGSDDGGTCGLAGDSCENVRCCDGYMCCTGNPVPAGVSRCYVSMCPVSDRNQKAGFAAVDAESVLSRLADLPITTWRYVWEPAEVRHMGPMAQDFKATFGLGTTDLRIFTIDEGGVALAAIQALERRIGSLRDENAVLREELGALRSRLDRLEGKAARR